MGDRDTEIEGDVAAVRAVGRWLRQDLQSGFDGYTVRNPGDGPPSAGASPSPDATPSEWDAWEARDAAVRRHNRRVEVWNQCVEDATAAWDTWQRALEAGASAWDRHDKDYVGLTGQLISANIQLELIRRATPHLTGEVDRMLTRAAELRAHADALRTPDGRVADRQRFYDLMDEADRLDDGHPAARRALSNWELPKGLTRGLWVIDLATTGYSIASDWEEEGPTQAITSNAVPAAASILAGTASGAYVGGVVGSFVPIPGVGTAAGVVVGAAVGTVVGAFTSGAIDSLVDSGADTIGDWGGAVVDGFEEVGDTFGAIGEGVGDVFDSIF